MFFRTNVGVKSGHAVRIFMPTRIGENLVETAFVKPLQRELKASELGELTGVTVLRNSEGEPESVTLTLSLVTQATRALERLADMLEKLDAPVGSTVQFEGKGDAFTFGVSHGLAVYLPTSDTQGDEWLDIVEVCTDAMDGTGLYQGSAQMADKTALYFYGDSYNSMRNAITFAMTNDPRCERAIVRRLT